MVYIDDVKSQAESIDARDRNGITECHTNQQKFEVNIVLQGNEGKLMAFLEEVDGLCKKYRNGNDEEKGKDNHCTEKHEEWGITEWDPVNNIEID